MERRLLIPLMLALVSLLWVASSHAKGNDEACPSKFHVCTPYDSLSYFLETDVLEGKLCFAKPVEQDEIWCKKYNGNGRLPYLPDFKNKATCGTTVQLKNSWGDMEEKSFLVVGYTESRGATGRGPWGYWINKRTARYCISYLSREYLCDESK